MEKSNLKKFNELFVPRTAADYRTIEEYWGELNSEDKIDHLKRLYIDTSLYNELPRH